MVRLTLFFPIQTWNWDEHAEERERAESGEVKHMHCVREASNAFVPSFSMDICSPSVWLNW